MAAQRELQFDPLGLTQCTLTEHRQAMLLMCVFRPSPFRCAQVVSGLEILLSSQAGPNA